MLFMYIHTHTVEKCVADKPQEVAKMFSKVQDEAKKAGIKTVGVYFVPHEHTMYIIFDAGDLAAIEKALVPFTLWGNARLIPILSMEQATAIGR